MTKVRCFVSFDYDNDARQKDMLLGQSKLEDSPFEISDYSIKEASSTWQQEARDRIKRSSVVIVMCGRQTNTAAGVSKELAIAQEEGIDYFLLNAYGDDSNVKKPTSAKSGDKIYKWTWDNLKALIHGRR